MPVDPRSPSSASPARVNTPPLVPVSASQASPPPCALPVFVVASLLLVDLLLEGVCQIDLPWIDGFRRLFSEAVEDGICSGTGGLAIIGCDEYARFCWGGRGGSGC